MSVNASPLAASRPTTITAISSSRGPSRCCRLRSCLFRPFMSVLQADGKAPPNLRGAGVLAAFAKGIDQRPGEVVSLNRFGNERLEHRHCERRLSAIEERLCQGIRDIRPHALDLDSNFGHG